MESLQSLNENSSTPNPSNPQPKDPEKNTILEIIGALTLKQIWGVLAAIGICLAAAFGMGYGLRDNVAKAEIERKQIEVDKTKKELEEAKKFYQNIDIKEEFLTLYTRYFKARDDSKETDDAAKNMATFLNQHLQEAKNSQTSAEKKITALRVGRGATPQQSTVIFSGDNTSWILPQEVIKHVNQNLLNNDALPKDKITESAPKSEPTPKEEKPKNHE